VILGGDIGGTKSRLALFDEGVAPVATTTYRTADFENAPELVETFLASFGASPNHACFGVAGPIRCGRVEPINVPWPVDAAELERRLRIRVVTLVNDVEAHARGIGALGDDDLAVLHAGAADAAGPRAVVSAGTGLGEAALWWDGSSHRPAASEGGSAAFAPSSPLEVDLYRFLAAERGRVNWGHVCSGQGLQNVYRFLSREDEAPEPAAITAEAEADRDSAASAAVDLFAAIYGARAGNVALAYRATGGVYLGGGIAPKILHRLQAGGFIRAFLAKGRLSSLLERIPVRVVLSADAAVIGAALVARELASFDAAAAA
jgi:glucokinase